MYIGETIENHDSSKQSVEIPMTKTKNAMTLNKCNQCNYASSYKSSLKTHLKTHSGERPNKCYQCDFAFIHASSLKSHLKIHNEEKSNKCNICDFAFIRAGDLRAHLKTHSGEKSNMTILKINTSHGNDLLSVRINKLILFYKLKNRKLSEKVEERFI